MKVHLTIDVEVWCGGWDRLDERFEASFERCVIGRSPAGDYALPKTLEVLRRHGLKAVFFVEVLFSARFGAAHLRRIVDMVRADGHEVQLHIHPEWIDEIALPIIPDRQVKRQHLTYYDLDEQTAIVAFGKQLLQAAGVDQIVAFRAGSYAANRDTLEAMRRNGIRVDSSFNACFSVSGPDLRDTHDLSAPFSEAGVASYPITTFRDGLGRLRPAQVGACSFEEMQETLDSGAAAGLSHFVIVSHSVELMHPNSTEPDPVVVSRFERLCAFLAARPSSFDVCGYETDTRPQASFTSRRELRSSASATLRRHLQQGQRAMAHRQARRPARRKRMTALPVPASLVPTDVAPTDVAPAGGALADGASAGSASAARPAAVSSRACTGVAFPVGGRSRSRVDAASSREVGRGPLAMRAVVIANRETPAVLGTAVRSLLAAVRGPAVIDVLVNGNPALADSVAAVDWPLPSADVEVQVWRLDLGDKANAWNRYVHDVWTPADCTYFVDGYVRVRPDALDALAQAARNAPQALVASGVPSAGRSAARLRRQMLAEGGVHGNLFMLPSVTMQSLRSRGFRLPLGIYRTESTLGAALCFGMEPARYPWNPRRFITVCPEATWDIDEKALWSVERIRSQWRRMGRQAQGMLENAAVRALLAGRKRSPEQLPRTVQELVRDWAGTDSAEVRGMLRLAPLRQAALRQLQVDRDWSLADREALLLHAVHGVVAPA